MSYSREYWRKKKEGYWQGLTPERRREIYKNAAQRNKDKDPMLCSLQELRDNMSSWQKNFIEQEFLNDLIKVIPGPVKTDDSWLENQLLKEQVKTKHGIKYINNKISLNQYLNYERTKI